MAVDQWVFSFDHLKNTPAVSLDRQSVLFELKRRNAGIEFLFRVGLQLKLCVGIISEKLQICLAQYVNLKYSLIESKKYTRSRYCFSLLSSFLHAPFD